MKIKVEECFGGGTRFVQLQVAEGKKWLDFGFMNYQERKEMADQLIQMAKELMK